MKNQKRTNTKESNKCPKPANTRKTKDPKCNSSERYEEKKKSYGSEPKGKMYNDPAWRMYNELLGNQVASYPFTEFVGGRFNLQPVSDDAISSAPAKSHPTQIMSVLFNPSVGFSDGAGTYDAINQAALKMYTQFSSNNMKTTQYGPQDITACILALGEILSLSEYIRRAIGFAGTVNVRNWFYPKQLVAAMGIDWNDLQKNVGIYRERFNYTAALASAIAFPKNLDYFKSCASLYSNVFLDHTSGMAQSIVTLPYSTWKLDEEGSSEGTVLRTIVMPYTGKGVANVPTDITPVRLDAILTIYEELLEAMFNSATLQYLYADVLKFVSNSTDALVTIPMIATDYGALPTYSEEFLINMENAVILHAPEDQAIEDPAGIIGTLATKSNDVLLKAGTNAVQYMPAFPCVWGGSVYARPWCDAFVNFHKDAPSTEERIMATRFVPSVKRVHNFQITGTAEKKMMTQFNLPDHYIVGLKVFRNIINTEGAMVISQLDFYNANLYKTRELEVFSHPITSVVGFVEAFAENNRLNIHSLNCYGELDVYTIVSNETMDKIVDLSILSLFSFK